jgi:hypothetical protein
VRVGCNFWSARRAALREKMQDLSRRKQNICQFLLNFPEIIAKICIKCVRIASNYTYLDF